MFKLCMVMLSAKALIKYHGTLELNIFWGWSCYTLVNYIHSLGLYEYIELINIILTLSIKVIRRFSIDKK